MDYLVIGGLTRDLQSNGATLPGGTSWYAAHAVAAWGGQVGLATVIDTSYAIRLPAAAALLRLPTPATATFINRYHGDERQQLVTAAPAPLDLASIPPRWRTTPLVHIAPLLDELPDAPWRTIFPHALIGLTPQGWLRTWDAGGRIHPRPWQPSPDLLANVDVVVLSTEDIGATPATTVAAWSQHGPIVALTRGSQGVTIWHANQRLDVAAYPARPVDPTGAGDVWAAAFLWHYQQQRTLAAAARWACAAAACAIEGPGVDTMPTPAAVAARMRM